MSDTELDTFLLENWGDLDRASARARQIEEAVFETIIDQAQAWAAERNWSGIYSYEGHFWLAPPEWTLSPGPKPKVDAWFQLDFFDDDQDYWSVTTLMGLGSGRAGFKLAQTRITAKAWKTRIAEPSSLAALPAFRLEPPASLVLPVRLDHREVVEGAAIGDYLKAVQPITAALDKLEAAATVIAPWLDELGDAA